MMTRNDFINTARGYLGTPFHHQGRLPGVGLDCIGTVVCALQANGYAVADQNNYGRIPANGLLQQAVLDHCDAISLVDVQPGDLMLFAFRDEPQHAAIVSSCNPLSLIHSYSLIGKVVEHDMDAVWHERLRGCYRLRGIE